MCFIKRRNIKEDRWEGKMGKKKEEEERMRMGT